MELKTFEHNRANVIKKFDLFREGKKTLWVKEKMLFSKGFLSWGLKNPDSLAKG